MHYHPPATGGEEPRGNGGGGGGGRGGFAAESRRPRGTYPRGIADSVTREGDYFHPM